MKYLILILVLFLMTGCVDGSYGGAGGYPNSGYGYPSSNYPSSGYGYPNSGGYNNPNNYPNNYPNNNYPSGNYNGNRNSCGGNKRCGGDSRPRDIVVAPPPPPPRPVEIQPSCPSGSVMDGRGCRVTDSSKRRPGGDGYINPCSGGTRYSGGRCI